MSNRKKGSSFVRNPGLSDEEKKSGEVTSEEGHLGKHVRGRSQEAMSGQANFDPDDCGSHTITRR